MTDGKRGPRTTEDTEIEAKLAIRSDDAAGVMDAVARLDGVTGFQFRPLPTVRIRDSYLELPGRGGEIGAEGGPTERRLALRRREVDGRALLTLKGEPEEPEEAEGEAAKAARAGTGAGVSRRLEIEVPEDAEGWRRIREALGEAGIQVGAGLGALHDLRPFQRRETVRMRRAVVPVRDEEGARNVEEHPVAEITMDTVTLELAGRLVRFREVEVEARPGVRDPVRLVDEVGAALVRAVGPELLPWRLSKLATGMALERLATAERLDAVVDENGDLLPEGLDQIESVGN